MKVQLDQSGVWELGEVIGRGGAGVVYVATSAIHPGEYVIKLVPKGRGAFRELYYAASLANRPNIVPVLDKGENVERTHLALLMPRAEGSLREFMDKVGGPTPEERALPILIDVARGLGSLSGIRLAKQAVIGVVHRDLKPENILYLDGSWCISDLGIARFLDENTGPDTRRYFMSHDYAAPEQWRGETATPQTDVYAFGVIAFELLVGSRPFVGADLRQQHLHENVPSIRGASHSLATIIAECLYKPSGVRPSPDRLLTRLENQAGETVSAGVPIMSGVSALQAADLAETARQGRNAWEAQEAENDARQREMLFRIAAEQWKRIKDLLNRTIVENAPTSRSGGLDDGALRLGDATIVMSPPVKPGPWDDLSPLVTEPPDQHRLPFDVIAYCYIAVGKSVSEFASLLSSGYAGRAHSLWFCDAEKRGQYAWYEVAFSLDRPIDSMADPLSLGYSGYFSAKSNGGYAPRIVPGHYLPIAAIPGKAARLSELGVGPVSAEEGKLGWGFFYKKFEVAWPLTSVLMGDLKVVP
ncbi:serine/threonine-protein kinase [Lentzea sp. NPDC005914]|uniref:serine/threonine-protein kinase n=1 Tax=Lentzea sp. NPDC005914 TaxID=3154572 RepID=UPI0033D499B7